MNSRRSAMTILILTTLLAIAGASAALAEAPPSGPQRLARPMPVPIAPAPTNITAILTPISAVLSWAAVPNVSGYMVSRAPVSTGPYASLTSVPFAQTSFVDNTVAPNTGYSWIVSAIYPDGRQGSSVPVTYTIPPVPNSAQTPPSIPGQTQRAPTTVHPPIVPIIPAGGPAPTGIVLTATPLVAHLSWNAMPNALRYAVLRAGGASAELTPPAFTGTQFQDVVPDPRITYLYTIVAYYPTTVAFYPNGAPAAAAPVQFISPPLINPPGFTARDGGNGTVVFQWQAVPGALRYRLDGPGLPITGYSVSSANTGASQPGIPAGPGSWGLVALYPGNYADYAGASVASAVIRVLPPHSQPWLSKNNGLGGILQTEMPFIDVFDLYRPNCHWWPGDPNKWWGTPVWTPAQAHHVALAESPRFVVDTSWLGSVMPDCRDYYDLIRRRNPKIVGLKLWLNVDLTATDPHPFLLWDEPAKAANEAVYGNPGDLGVGRRTDCWQALAGDPPDLHTYCYATSHGIPPGRAGFNDAQAITHPGVGVGPDFIQAGLIAKDGTGSVFLVFSPSGTYTVSPFAQLDSDGPKVTPFVCLSCHGGTYNPVTTKVDGASLLPIDPGLLLFASPADQAAQEEKIRTINLMIYNVHPESAISAYLRGLYNGAIAVPGTRAQPDYIPAGWTPQAGFYRQIVRPYCAMCHLAAPSQYNFASWDNFQHNAGLIYNAVCVAHTMPHNELQFKGFWTKDTGPLYLPGLLAYMTGHAGCP